MLIPRIITAVFLVACMLGGLFSLPAPYWPAFAAVIILPALWEWTRLFHITGLAQVGYLGFSALMMYAVASTGQMPGAGMQVLSLLMWLVVAPLWLWRRWKLVDRNQAAMLGWLLLMPAWFALLAWRPGPEQGPALLAVMALVWIADTAAYFAGRAFGKHKLAPAISPGKSWEGVAGGMLATGIYTLWVGHSGVFDFSLPWWGWLAAGWALTAVSVVGDLLESWFKRAAGVKDSSQLLPGHGGVLDRIDSLIAVLAVSQAARYLATQWM